ncbi:O-linked N-acetylglucosamine transferase, SPINDLY family protein [Allochromatium vinosum]|uniref:O-linked N-acetylglucosamine transferase, SPINDLY family protein n=1 Tax=Allochromatium vinosum TaxID=1049 RepID=UPI0019037F77|nr:tetratricopeptide repeat protein [Allochromatium vinosum]
MAEPSFAAAQPAEREALFECLRLKQFDAAREQASQLTQRYPGDALGWKVLGTLLVHQGDHEAARTALEEARRLDPQDAEILNSLGQALQGLDCPDEALDVYREALRLQPESAECWHNHALILHAQGRLEEALTSYDQAVRIRPDYAKAHYNRGSLLSDLGRPGDALLAYERALEIKPDSAESFNIRALALLDLGRLTEALASLDRALEIQPNFAGALSNRGNVLKDLGRLDEAIASYGRALALQPGLMAAQQSRLLCLNYRTDFTPRQLFDEHRAFDARYASRVEPLPSDTARDRTPERRLRLGFVSGDFHQHSVAFFLRPVLEHIDHDRFEVFCYAMGLKQDDWTHDFQRLADVWVESATMTPEALAERIRADAIDLLVDLSGHTKHNALRTFMAKPAPVQITWIGYPNTTGLSSLDYRLVDAITDPPGMADATHSECLIRLPRGFLCYRPRASEEALPLAPAPCLERGFVTFASFNNLAKITPATLDLWSEILTAVPGSRLRLKSNQAADPHVWDRILEHFAAQGIAPERLERLPRAADHLDHLALYRDVDIALDTYPYHGTTTTCEALFMGVPVITLAGDRHAARVGASLLTHVGLTELIADSPPDYVRLAVDLAQDRTRLSELHAGLRTRLKASPLRDEAGFTRILESALRQMWRLWCAGESPRVFEVESPLDQSVSQDVDREQQAPHAAVPVAPKDKRAGRKQNKRQGKSTSKAKTGKYPTDTALASADVAEPSQPPGELRTALMLFRHGHFERAASQARRFTERHPTEIFGWKLLGTSLVKSGRFEEALAPLLEAVRVKPKEAENINTLGFALMSLGRLDEAIGCYKRAIEIDPDYSIAYNNLGTIYRDRAQFDRAIACYDQALERDPEYPEAHLNRGVALGELGWLEQSVTCYQRALELQPTSVATLNNLGKSEMMLGHLDAAQRAYRRALELQPDLSQSFSNLLLCLNYEAGLAREQVFAEHRAFESTQASRITRLPPLAHLGQDPERRLRLGFVSGDLRFHSVAYFLLPVLEQLDRERFQVFCYSRSHRQDEVTQVFRGLADAWLDCPAMPEQELAERIRADGIDLLFDLSGHTGASALRAFAAKPAPVQITWIGYPNTTGLSTMDYRLVDALTDPPGEADAYHTERLIRLPTGFLCYRPWSTGFALPVTAPPCLEASHITFGSFNNLSKITPATLDLWVEVMRAVPNARLLLKSHTASDIQVWNRLVASFESAGIAPERLEFLPRAPSYTEHLEQYSRLDIALDTYPYHGTTTTCEALFMGVPVVTLAGDRHAARVGVSLLTQAGLPEFIADSNADFVTIAVRLAESPARLAELRAGLRERLECSPLRDEVGFTRTLEAVLRRMWRLWCQGEPPQVFEVSDKKKA